MTAPGPLVTVVVCTRNRAPYVGDAIASLRNQTAPPESFEILVVDNGSTDSTPVLLAELTTTTPNLRWVSEPERGLSPARNRGVAEAAGELVLFLDDDAIADPTWVAELSGALGTPGVVAAGGRIRLRWPAHRPPWLPAAGDSLYSGFDVGEAPVVLTYPATPFGANMGFRRSAFADIGGFSTALGRRASSLLSGEEKELFFRLAQRGDVVVYVPDAQVDHRVLDGRASRRWILRRSFDQGRSEIVVEALTVGVGGAPRRAARAALHTARSLGALARLRPSGVMASAIPAAHWLGSAVQNLTLSHHGGPPAPPVPAPVDGR
jgi:glycosyltransferase involved in cell wall biosynthesis